MRVALLRGINVGGHRRVPMADLQVALGDAGLDPTRAPHDRWALLGGDLHVRYGRGSASSRATIDWFARQLGVAMTGRNLVTVRALVDRAPA